MTEQEQIIRDIDRWARKRLEQWCVDVVMRFDIAGIPPREGQFIITSLLIDMAAKALALTTNPDVPPEEIGALFASLVTNSHKEFRERGLEEQQCAKTVRDAATHANLKSQKP